MVMNVLVAGASRGIGLELAKRYAASGAHVIATVRSMSSATELTSLGVEVQLLDIGSMSSAQDLAKKLENRAIHLLICNAAVLIGRGGIMDSDYSEETFAVTMKTNVFGPFNLIRALLPSLKFAADSEHGCRVALIGSVLASSTTIGMRTFHSYTASKVAATNLIQNIGVELGKDGIVVGSIHPGWVQTDMGGDGAQVSVADSVDGLMARFDEMTSARSRTVYSYTGDVIPP